MDPTRPEAKGWRPIQLAVFGLNVADAIKFTLDHYRCSRTIVTW